MWSQNQCCTSWFSNLAILKILFTGCPKSQVPNLHTETNESIYSALHVVRSTISELCIRRNGSASEMCARISPLGVCVRFGTMQVAGCQSGLASDGGFGRLAGSSSVDNLVYDRRPSARFTFIRRSAI